jgi:hypothetical protein
MGMVAGWERGFFLWMVGRMGMDLLPGMVLLFLLMPVPVLTFL